MIINILHGNWMMMAGMMRAFLHFLKITLMIEAISGAAALVTDKRC